MNSCILMAKIVRSPELRYTQDNQIPIVQMLVEFDGLRPEDPPGTLKVVVWGDMAREIEPQYSKGDRLIIQGRLEMNTIDRQEGFKEKRAELIASRIHSLDGSKDHSASSSRQVSTPRPDNVVSMDSFKPTTQESEGTNVEASLNSQTIETETVPITTAPNPAEQDLDDIPF
ncbi:MAG: single-stranded DNA-binding protein [Xenococcaceae cyanobacterium]